MQFEEGVIRYGGYVIASEICMQVISIEITPINSYLFIELKPKTSRIMTNYSWFSRDVTGLSKFGCPPYLCLPESVKFIICKPDLY